MYKSFLTLLFTSTHFSAPSYVLYIEMQYCFDPKHGLYQQKGNEGLEVEQMKFLTPLADFSKVTILLMVQVNLEKPPLWNILNAKDNSGETTKNEQHKTSCEGKPL